MVGLQAVAARESDLDYEVGVELQKKMYLILGRNEAIKKESIRSLQRGRLRCLAG